MSGPRPVRAPRGTQLSTLGWQQEAALRMLQNNLDPEVAEHPDKLVVYGGTGKAARDWRSFDAMVRTLQGLKQDETMLVQSGRPVGVMQTHEWAPRVLIANSNLVGDWANWEEFRRLEALGLTMYGQMTAGSWIYIGTQGILQGTYETFAAVAAKRFGGSLAGTITLTAGLGGMGGAQPLAVTMNDGVAICVDCDPRAIDRRIEHRYLDVKADSLDHALRLAVEARDARRPLSVGVLGNAAEAVPQLLAMGAPIDIVTDQTSAHDPLAYLPLGTAFEDMADAAAKDPAGFTTRARESMARHVEAMVGFQDAGAEVFDYGNSIRGEAQLAGYERAFAFPGFVPAYIRPLFCEGKGPSAGPPCPATPPTSRRPTARSSTSSRRTSPSPAGSRWPANASTSRACPPASAGSATANATRPASASTTWSRAASCPRRSSSAATTSTAAPSPPLPGDRGDARRVRRHRRLAPAQRHGERRLRRLLGVPPPWRRRRHGPLPARRAGHRRRRHPLAGEKIRRVLTNDPGMGVIRHVDAGYDIAESVADERGVRIPMREGEEA